MSIPYVVNYRVSHSKPGDVLVCSNLTECHSDSASFVANYFLGTGEHLVVGTSKTVQMSLTFPSAGVIDGRPLVVMNNYAALIAEHPSPLPSSDFVEVYNRLGVPVPFEGGLEDANQSFTLTIELVVPKIESKLVYDPDVSIRLLFVPDDEALPPSGSDTSREANLTAVIVAAVVVPIVIALGILVFAKFIFPYVRRRRRSGSPSMEQLENERPEPEDAESTQVKRTESSTWTSAKPPTI